jgi:BCS1 N terminal.
MNILAPQNQNLSSIFYTVRPYDVKFFMYLRYGGTWIRVERTREQQTLDLHMGVPWETVTLTAFGRNKQMYFSILEEGM